MEIVLLSCACVFNSVAIILIWVSLRRGNRWGRGATYSDLKRAFEAQKMLDKINGVGSDFSDRLTDICRRYSDD